ncbi:MAG: sigma-70 family RNA polymerase sigma factor [Planctomycetes bacterium]|nr:sigma-70 family RNA polymerase sigma factor [Planctomycetota bacterium]
MQPRPLTPPSEPHREPEPSERAQERALVEALAAGSRLAFLRLLEGHAACIRGYLAQQLPTPGDVDDVAQEVFLAALKSAASYRGEGGVRAWLLGIARLRALDLLRQRARRRERSGDGVLEERLHERALARLEDEDYELRRARRIDALRTCVARLEERPRRLVERFYFHGESADVLAQEIGRSASAIRMTLLRLRGILRRCVEGDLATGDEG